MYNIAKRNVGIDPGAINAAVAECRFMRAIAYFHLVRTWGNVMIIENNLDLPEQPLVPLNPIRDIYKFIIRGRVNALKLV